MFQTQGVITQGDYYSKAYSTGTTFSTGAAIYSYADGAAWTATSAPSYLSFQTVPSGLTGLKERMRIDSAGDVFISPRATAASSGSGILYFKNVDDTSTTINGGSIRTVDSTNNPSGADMRFQIANDNGTLFDAVTIDSNGFVGIGDMSPDVELDVSGKGRFERSTGEVLKLNSTTANGCFATWENNNTDIGYIGSSFHLWNAPNNVAGNFGIRANTRLDLGVQANVYMTILNSGNVGIETTTPGTALQVGGLDDGSNYDITLGWNAVAGDAVGTKRSALTFKTGQNSVNQEDIYKWDIAMLAATATNATENFGSDLAFLRSTRSSTDVDAVTMLLSRTGNVGIGTTSPDRALEVESTSGIGSMVLTGTTGSTLYFRPTASYSPGGNFGILVTGGSGPEFLSTMKFSGYHTSSGGVNTIMTLKGDGNVGIGTTLPVSSLNITTTKTVALDTAAKFLTLGLTVDDLTAGDTAGGGGGIAFRSKNDNSGTQVVFGAIDAIKESANVSDFKGALRFFTNQNSTGVPLERMRIDSSGNVGIGTTSPVARLDVRKNQAGYTYIASDNANTAASGTGSGFVMTEGGSVAWYLRNERDGSGKFNIGNSANRLTIDSSGNVGIGTTAPGYNLEVRGNADQSLYLAKTGTTYLRATASANAESELFTGGSMVLGSGNAERMRVDSSGSVLFGTTGVPNGTSVYGAGFIPEADDRSTLFLATSRSTAAALIIFYNPNGVAGSISTSGSATAFNTSSDYRLKEDLKDFDGLDKVSKIPVYDFKWKVDESRSYGVMAHELQEVLPDAVSGEKDAEEMQGVDYSKIVPLLIKSIQELEAKVKILENK